MKVFRLRNVFGLEIGKLIWCRLFSVIEFRFLVWLEMKIIVMLCLVVNWVNFIVLGSVWVVFFLY